MTDSKKFDKELEAIQKRWDGQRCKSHQAEPHPKCDTCNLLRLSIGYGVLKLTELPVGWRAAPASEHESLKNAVVRLVEQKHRVEIELEHAHTARKMYKKSAEDEAKEKDKAQYEAATTARDTLLRAAERLEGEGDCECKSEGQAEDPHEREHEDTCKWKWCEEWGRYFRDKSKEAAP